MSYNLGRSIEVNVRKQKSAHGLEYTRTWLKRVEEQLRLRLKPNTKSQLAQPNKGYVGQNTVDSFELA